MPEGKNIQMDTGALIEALWQIAKSPDTSIAELRELRQAIREADRQLTHRLLTSQF